MWPFDQIRIRDIQASIGNLMTHLLWLVTLVRTRILSTWHWGQSRRQNVSNQTKKVLCVRGNELRC